MIRTYAHLKPFEKSVSCTGIPSTSINNDFTKKALYEGRITIANYSEDKALMMHKLEMRSHWAYIKMMIPQCITH